MRMARSPRWPCSTCAYWQSYPEWKEVGTCDYALSRNYGRMAFGGAQPCEYYASSRGASASGPGGRPGTVCEACHYWLPFELMHHVGQCDNPDSRYFRSPAFSDKPAEECFAARSIEGLEFMWCQSHRQTIYAAELPDHRGCQIFPSSVSLPVEDEMELTLAGD